MRDTRGFVTVVRSSPALRHRFPSLGAHCAAAKDYVDVLSTGLGLLGLRPDLALALGNRQHVDRHCRDLGRRHPRLRSSAGVSGIWSL